MDEIPINAAQAQMSKLAQAIALLCKKAEMPIPLFKREIAKKDKSYTLHPGQVKSIFSEDPERPDPTGPTFDKILRFFAETARLYISRAFFDMSISEQKNFLTKINKFSPDFFSTYQIIRPFQNDPNSYALEAFEIIADDRGIVNLMYSHNELVPIDRTVWRLV